MPRRGVFESESIVSGIPRDLGIDDRKEKREKIRELQGNELSPFYKKDMKDVFIYALALARNSGADGEKLEPRSPSIPYSSFTDEQAVLMVSLAIATEENVEFLRDNEKTRAAILELEELANAGIDILYDEVFRSGLGTPERKLEKQLFEISEEL